jgi:threonine dehydrogenase-like Zn-dependent dehydrogenase
VPHGVSLDGADLFFRNVRLLGGPARARRYLPPLIDLVFAGTISPGMVFDLVLPLDVAEGSRDGRAPRDQNTAAPLTRQRHRGAPRGPLDAFPV